MVDADASTLSSSPRKLSRTFVYRTSQSPTYGKSPAHPLAVEMLQAKRRVQTNHQKLLEAENRIRKLRIQEEKLKKEADKKERDRVFKERVHERRVQEEMEKQRVKADRHAAEIETRLRNLRDKRIRTDLISTARGRLMREKFEQAELGKQEKEFLDRLLEAQREEERRLNYERKNSVERCKREEKQRRLQSAEGAREHVRGQYETRLQQEQRLAEEHERRLQELEAEELELLTRYRSSLNGQPPSLGGTALSL